MSSNIERTRFSYEDGEKTKCGDVVLSAARSTFNRQDCVAHAIVSTMEAKYRIFWSETMRRPFPYTLSVQEIHDRYVSGDSSGEFSEALLLTSVHGVTTEAYYPKKLDTDPIPLVPSPRFRIKKFHQLALEPEKIANCIKSDGPVICIMRMDSSYNNLSRINEALGVYRAAGEQYFMNLSDGRPVLASQLQRGSRYILLCHAVPLVGYFWSIAGELLFRFQDNAGPKMGRSGVRSISIDAILEVYEIEVGGYDSVTI